MNYWKEWFKCAGMRALKTFGQTFGGMIGTNVVKVTELDITGMFLVAITSSIFSIAMSLGGLPELKEPKHPDQVDSDD